MLSIHGHAAKRCRTHAPVHDVRPRQIDVQAQAIESA
jgi:hypothetical protein